MAFFPQVKKGDKFIPSAELENKVRSFFNGVSTISAGKNKISTFNNNVLVAWTNKPVPPFTAVKISGVTTDNTNASAEDRSVYFSVLPADASGGVWGICEGGCSEGKDYVTVIMSGFARAFITGSGNYASPGADGKLVAGSSGKALILYKGDEKTPGIVQLGYSAGAKKDEYTGPFKLRHIEGRTFEICHGVYYDRPNDYDYNVAGYTDLPKAGVVKRQNIILPENRTGADVYLHAIYEDGKYRVEIDFDSYKGFQTIYLGAIRANGEVVQEYQERGTIYFGRQWYL